jgi:hypothetical protein
MQKPDVDGVGEDPQIRVRLPARPPALYPHVARVLRRIVVRLAQKKRGADGSSQTEQRAS